MRSESVDLVGNSLWLSVCNQKHTLVSISLQGRLDVRDAASSSFLNEVAATLKELQMLCGDDFLAYLQSTAIPATKLPSSVQV